MSVRGFFQAAESAFVSRFQRRSDMGIARPIHLLERAMETAMVEERRYPIIGVRPWYRLVRGEGAQARARLLVAASRIGLAPASMWPGETVGDWLGRGLRENLRHEQIVPLLRAAARARRVLLRDLDARAP